MFRISFLLLLLILTSTICNSQSDSNYVETFNEQLALSYFASARSLSLSFAPKSDAGIAADPNTADYRPNIRRVSGFGFFYKNIGLNIGFQAPSSINNVDQYGKSKYRDISLHYIKPKLIGDLYYQDYKGFADYNTSSNDPTPPNNGVLNLRPDIHVGYIKAKVMYVSKGKKYSYRSAFKFIERQTKSAGSPLLIAHGYHLRASADSAFLPSDFRDNYDLFKDLRAYRLTGLGLGAGYSHTFVLNHKFFITPLIALGMDIQHQHYNLAVSSDNRMSLAPLADLRLSIGYNGDRLFIGLNFIDDITSAHFKELVTSSQYFRFNLILGYRFKAPKFIKKARKAIPIGKV